MITNNFARRHNGPAPEQTRTMLQVIGVDSMDELIEKTVPARIRLPKPLDLPPAMNEYEYLNHLHALAAKNQVFRSYIGMGYYNCITPAVITRNILENPGWYTSYTPYQAEISQGRLEALLNYQTMVGDMTGLPLVNASLLDEGTAAAEAMIMFYHGRNRDKVKANAAVCFVDERIFPQTLSVIETRAHLLGLEIRTGRMEEFTFTPEVFGAIVQQIDRNGQVHELKPFIDKAHAAGALVAVASDLMALAVLRAPGQDGADCVLGNSQRFGLPLGFGGPSAGFFACTDTFKRSIPGRIIGITVDAQGNRALRLALQTREQHIKRDKATSNICTAQALMAVMSGMYAVYHGKDGIRQIALDIHANAKRIAKRGAEYGFRQLNTVFFDTLCFESPVPIETVRQIAIEHRINFNYIDAKRFSISVDETTSLHDAREIIGILARAVGKEHVCQGGHCCQGNCKHEVTEDIPQALRRDTPYLEHSVFNTYHSETEMMRYIKKLEEKDLSLNRAMIPLGSCTMKLNAAAEMMCLSLPGLASIHPFVPADQAQGYHELIDRLEKDLCEITGFAKALFQPNSGAAGEYAGLSVIRAYQEAKGEGHRNICLIPASAHGTNPASAAMAGLKVVVVASTPEGEIDVNDLKAKVAEMGKDVSCLMITYPSTHGVFEEAVLDILEIVHGCGAQVYMDGANMNAQVGLTSPGFMGADVCHLNLHKTFAMPHGGRPHLRGQASGAVPARPRDGSRESYRTRRRLLVALRQRVHTAHHLRLYPHVGRRRPQVGHRTRHLERQLPACTAQGSLQDLLHRQARHVRARNDLGLQRFHDERQHPSGRYSQTTDGLWFPRSYRGVPRSWHVDGGTHRKRTSFRTGSSGRCVCGHPSGNRRHRKRQGRPREQHHQKRAAHAIRGLRRRMEISLYPQTSRFPAAAR